MSARRELDELANLFVDEGDDQDEDELDGDTYERCSRCLQFFLPEELGNHGYCVECEHGD